MGLCQSNVVNVPALKSKAIEKEMTRELVAPRQDVKILLLGPSESGKSTILKQMQILHSHRFRTKEEENEQKRVIYRNTIQAMASVLRGMTSCEIQFENPEREIDRLVVLLAVKAGRESEPFSPVLAKALKALCKDKGVCVDAIKRKNEFRMPSNVPHFLASIERISSPDYKPTDQDILLSQTKTTGIVEVKFRVNNAIFRVFDVGGQKSEREKWYRCFEDVDAVIFIVAISEYDQMFFQDVPTNRMIESMNLFEGVCEVEMFIYTSIVLFFNKEDLYVEKLKRVPITVAFPEYKGTQSYEETTRFIEKKFDCLNKDRMKQIYKHHTCATDTNQVSSIIGSVLDMTILYNLRGSILF